MKTDYLSELKYLGLFSRIKRLSDNTIANGRKLYQKIDIGIEPNWFLIFRIILEKEKTSLSEITSILKFSHPSIIAIIKKMEEAGYIKITQHKSDKRKQNIQLTTKAKNQIPEMQKVWNASEKAVASVFENETFLKEVENIEKAFEETSFSDRVLHFMNEEEIEIKSFTEKDSSKFSELNKYWLKKYFHVEPIDELVLNNPTEHILNKGGHILMVYSNEEAIGTVALIPISKKEIELGKMAVNPAFQQRGIGKKLLKESIKLAKGLTYDSIILYSNTKLEPAIKLYKQLGFEKIKLEKDVVFDRANIKMKLKL